MTEEQTQEIIMYSTGWCPDCIRAKFVFKRMKVAYKNVDIGQDKEAREFVLRHHGGRRIVPTIIFPDGSSMAEPSNSELAAKLVELGLAE